MLFIGVATTKCAVPACRRRDLGEFGFCGPCWDALEGADQEEVRRAKAELPSAGEARLHRAIVLACNHLTAARARPAFPGRQVLVACS